MGKGPMPDAPRPLPPKKDVALALLEREPSVYVHLDPRRAGVSVPKWFTTQPQLVLQIGMNMPIPIHDLKVDDEGVSCTLSFSRTPFWCRIPWTAIWALVGEDQRGMVWPEDVPPELASQKQQQQKGPQAVSQKPSKRPRARLAAVEPNGGHDESPKPRPRPHLEAAPAPAGDEGSVEEAGAPPQPAPGPRAVPQPAPAPAEAQAPEDDGEGKGPGETPAPRPAGGRPKRELPPYLRVIK